MLIKGFSRDLCHYIITECRRSISCHYCVNLDCVFVTDRHFHLFVASDIDSVCDQYFYQLTVVRVNCFHNLSHFVGTKVSKIFGICNSLPKKNEKKVDEKIFGYFDYFSILSQYKQRDDRPEAQVKKPYQVGSTHWRRLAAWEVYGLASYSFSVIYL